MNKDEIRLEGELIRNISLPYQSSNGTNFYVAHLIDSDNREFALFFWDDNRFDYDTKLKIKELAKGEYIVVYAQKIINPKNGKEIYNVTQFGESSEDEEAEMF